MIKKSQFYMDLVKDLSSNTRLEKLEIKELRFGVDQTRLFDLKKVINRKLINNATHVFQSSSLMSLLHSTTKILKCYIKLGH